MRRQRLPELGKRRRHIAETLIGKAASGESGNVIRHNGQRAIVGLRHFGVAMHGLISQRQLLQCVKIPRIQFQGALQIFRRFIPVTFAAID